MQGLGLRFPQVRASLSQDVSLLRHTLENLRAKLDTGHVDQDPLGFVHRYSDPLDQEVAGFLAAVFAYGRLDLILRNLESLFRPLTERPAQWILRTSLADWTRAYRGFWYRFQKEEDLLTLLWLLQDLLARHGSIQEAFSRCLVRDEQGRLNLRLSLSAWTRYLRERVGSAPGTLIHRGTPGLYHLLAGPDAGSPCKRWNLYLRWMVRGPDRFDLGIWRSLSSRDLLMPLDTHTTRIARWLGLTKMSSPSWKMAEEVTSSLRRLHPEDPVRYDFPLARLGITGLCPRYPEPDLCRACLLKEICHAQRRS